VSFPSGICCLSALLRCPISIAHRFCCMPCTRVKLKASAIVVTDQSGVVVADANVTLRRQSDAKVFTTRTDVQGHVELPGIPAGIYEITVYHNGLATLPRQDVSIPLQKPLTLRFSLAVWIGEVTPADPTFHLDTKSAPAPGLVEPSSPPPIENLKTANSANPPSKLHNFFSKLKHIF
jgi:hypothetical protein